jgi:hypothetical protein
MDFLHPSCSSPFSPSPVFIFLCAMQAFTTALIFFVALPPFVSVHVLFFLSPFFKLGAGAGDNLSCDI